MASIKNTPRVALPRLDRQKSVARDLLTRFAPHMEALAGRVLDVEDAIAPLGAYPRRLALEILLGLPSPVSDAEVIAEKIRESGWRHSGPFNSLTFALYQQTGDRTWLNEFHQESRQSLGKRPLSPEGAWLHPKGGHGIGHAVLLDGFQEEASRLVKLAWMIESGDLWYAQEDPETLRETALAQFRVHRRLLENTDSGLWHNGRGWVVEDPATLSPGAWSRGHGWLLRGLRESLRFLPPCPARRELATLNETLCRTLLNWRDPEGCWHALLHRDPATSPVETSGSAMIAAAFLTGVRAGDLPAEPFLDAGLFTARNLLDHFLTADGGVLSSCPGPGPLCSEKDYLLPVRFPRDEIHGFPALLMLWRGLHKIAAPDLP